MPGDRVTNCANCAIATDATLAGRPASALPGEVTTAGDVAAAYGRSWRGPGSIDQLTGHLQAAGPGARGIILGERGPGEVGHFFNGVNQGGTVRLLDGQVGGRAETTGYTRFWLLRTD
jgi:filamentous hemagglutinin